jgi:hypothetical protein
LGVNVGDECIHVSLFHLPPGADESEGALRPSGRSYLLEALQVVHAHEGGQGLPPALNHVVFAAACDPGDKRRKVSLGLGSTDSLGHESTSCKSVIMTILYVFPTGCDPLEAKRFRSKGQVGKERLAQLGGELG